MGIVSLIFKTIGLIGLVILLPLLLREWRVFLIGLIVTLGICGIARLGWLLFGNWRGRPNKSGPQARSRRRAG